jgi:hypothetical protein
MQGDRGAGEGAAERYEWRKGFVSLDALLRGDVRSWESLRPPGRRARPQGARAGELGHLEDRGDERRLRHKQGIEETNADRGEEGIGGWDRRGEGIRPRQCEAWGRGSRRKDPDNASRIGGGKGSLRLTRY